MSQMRLLLSGLVAFLSRVPTIELALVVPGAFQHYLRCAGEAGEPCDAHAGCTLMCGPVSVRIRFAPRALCMLYSEPIASADWHFVTNRVVTAVTKKQKNKKKT